jgi:hypothetical protein
MKAIAFFILLLCLYPWDTRGLPGYHTNLQFQQWFPQFKEGYEAALNNNYSKQFNAYRAQLFGLSPIDVIGGAGEWTQLVQPVIQCILGSLSEYIKANMACAQVILGLTPILLAGIGPTTDEFAQLAVISGRPALSMLLAMASPNTFSTRIFEHQDYRSLVRRQKKHKRYRLPQWFKSRKWEYAIVAIEYVVAMMALTNTGHVVYDLSLKAISTISPEKIFLPISWVVSGFLCHMIGILSLQCRTEVETNQDVSNLSTWCRWLQSEFRLSLNRKKLTVMDREDSFKGKIGKYLDSFLSVTVCIQLISGSVILSSLLFLGTIDAFSVIGLFALSSLTCRVVMMIELACLAEAKPCFEPSGQVSSDED